MGDHIVRARKRGEVFLAEAEEAPKPGAICPLCPGNEAMTPPEVLAIRPAFVCVPAEQRKLDTEGRAQQVPGLLASKRPS